jgi:uroporphyrinogen decarboxylase
MRDDLLTTEVTPDWEGLVRCVKREGMPERVHHIELFLDYEVKNAIGERYGLLDGLDPDDPLIWAKRELSFQRFLGYDFVRATLDDFEWTFKTSATQDTAAIGREGGREYMNTHRGPISNWEEFEAYPWPDPTRASTRTLEWYQENLPDDMCIIGMGGFAHAAEHLSWLMGYETLCYALFEQRDLVKAMAKRLIETDTITLRRILEFDRVKIIWGSDDMGFRSGTLISPDDLREFCLPTHKLMARMAHDTGRPYLLHCCGNIREIMPDLIEDVRIDARHSFEDAIEPVVEAKKTWGDRIAILGGIDVDFLTTANEQQIRQRVRETLDACMPGGGYCLGSGNSVANYIPVDNYLVMLDEGRKYHIG